MPIDDITGKELLAAILDNPKDDAPRLIYADWLDEQGEEERAGFIREQIANPSNSIGQTYHGLWVVGRRGFTYRVECRTAEQWFQVADLMNSFNPIEQVRLGTRPALDVIGYVHQNFGLSIRRYSVRGPTAASSRFLETWGHRTDPYLSPEEFLARAWPKITFEIPPMRSTKVEIVPTRTPPPLKQIVR